MMWLLLRRMYYLFFGSEGEAEFFRVLMANPSAKLVCLVLDTRPVPHVFLWTENWFRCYEDRSGYRMNPPGPIYTTLLENASGNGESILQILSEFSHKETKDISIRRNCLDICFGNATWKRAYRIPFQLADDSSHSTILQLQAMIDNEFVKSSTSVRRLSH
jgi:hypothetical protein